MEGHVLNVAAFGGLLASYCPIWKSKTLEEKENKIWHLSGSLTLEGRCSFYLPRCQHNLVIGPQSWSDSKLKHTVRVNREPGLRKCRLQ